MNDSVLERDQPVIDFEGLKARCLGNLNLVERVLCKFATQLDTDLTALERAVLEGDTDSAALVAHRIKGMSANVEARDLFRSATTVERLAKEACVAELPEQLTRMRQHGMAIAESIKNKAIGAL